MFLKFKNLQYDLGSLQIQILELLKKKAMYGYEIIKDLEEFKLNTAILYPALKELEGLGLVKSFYSSQARGHKKRKNYELTEDGFDFVQSLYDMAQVPDFYLDFFNKEADLIKQAVIGKECLVIDSTNFISAKSLLDTKYFYNYEIPSNVKFIRYYDFKKQDSGEQVDLILLAFPFFIQFNINTDLKKSLIEFFEKARNRLNPNGTVWALDLYWDRQAIVDTFTYLIAGKVKKMGFTPDEMKDLLFQAGFSKFDVIRMEKGIIVFTVT